MRSYYVTTNAPGRISCGGLLFRQGQALGSTYLSRYLPRGVQQEYPMGSRTVHARTIQHPDRTGDVSLPGRERYNNVLAK